MHKLRLENKKLKTETPPDKPETPAKPEKSPEANNARVRILEEQLLKNAKEAASQISELKMQLFEIEMGLESERTESFAMENDATPEDFDSVSVE